MKNLGNLMKQAQEMQEKMAKFQEELESLEIDGQAGGGLVRLTLGGKGALKGVRIDPSLLKPEEAEVVEDLILAAFNDAKSKLDEKVQSETQAMMGGLPLPPGMKLPF